MTWTYVCKMMIERLAGGRIRAKYGDKIIKVLMAEFPELYMNDMTPEDYQLIPIINGVLIAHGEEMV